MTIELIVGLVVVVILLGFAFKALVPSGPSQESSAGSDADAKTYAGTSHDVGSSPDGGAD